MNCDPFYLILGIVFVFGLVLLSTNDYKDSKEFDKHYCQMVDIYNVSKGQYGWPPYKGKEVCSVD
jgi:hypothetical protein